MAQLIILAGPEVIALEYATISQPPPIMQLIEVSSKLRVLMDFLNWKLAILVPEYLKTTIIKCLILCKVIGIPILGLWGFYVNHFICTTKF